MRKKGSFQFIIGFVFGAILFSSVTIYAKDIMAKSTSTKIVNSSKKQITLNGFEINGEKYFKLSDVAKADNIFLSYDSTSKVYTLNKTKKYIAEKKEEIQKEELDGYKTTSITTKKGDVIETKKGNYNILVGKTEKEKPLPAWQKEWDDYPKVEFPTGKPERMIGESYGREYDLMYINNEYELERLIRTIYLYAKDNEDLWENDDPSTNIPNFTIKIEYTDDMVYNTFYPWRDFSVERLVTSTFGGKEFRIYVYDAYNLSEFMETQYFLK